MFQAHRCDDIVSIWQENIWHKKLKDLKEKNAQTTSQLHSSHMLVK